MLIACIVNIRSQQVIWGETGALGDIEEARVFGAQLEEGNPTIPQLRLVRE
jgi:hypothetical protein